MNALQRKAVIKEFQDYLILKYRTFDTEKAFKDIMPTERRFKADYYISKINTILEINGGQWTFGRHNRGGVGYEADLTKSNIANQNGVPYYQFTYEMLMNGEYKKYV